MDATVPALAVKDRKLGLPLRLIDDDWNKDAVLRDILLQLKKLFGVEQDSGIICAWLDLVGGQVGSELAWLPLCVRN